MKKLFIIIYIFSASNLYAQKVKYSDPNTCPFVLENIVELKLPEEGYSHPKLSSDGSKMLLTKNYSGVYVVNLNNPDKIKTVSTGRMDGFSMNWCGNGDEISFKRSTRVSEGNFKREYFRFDMYSPISSSSTHDITDFKNPISTFKKMSNNLIIQYDIESKKIIANNGEKTWDITSEMDLCMDIVLSPDKRKVVFTSYGGEYVYAVDGSGLINRLYAGLSKCWSPDGGYILYFKEDEKGTHQVVESDLYICKADGSRYWKLTDTPNLIEIWPHWSANGKRITFMDEKKGKIYIADIHAKNKEK